MCTSAAIIPVHIISVPEPNAMSNFMRQYRSNGLHRLAADCGSTYLNRTVWAPGGSRKSGGSEITACRYFRYGNICAG